jgi:hypothetical protein
VTVGRLAAGRTGHRYNSILSKVVEVQQSIEDVKAPVIENADIDMQRFEQRYKNKAELL